MNTTPILHFLDELAAHNHKAWFDENRKSYQKVKGLFEELTTLLLKDLQAFDDSLLDLEPKKCIFRINRDVRFSKDKSPYKLNFGAYFQKGGKKAIGAGYYLHIQPQNESFIAGGIYAPQAPELAKIRQEIDYNWEEFKAIVEAPHFQASFGGLAGEKIKGTPKGYASDNPALAYLQHKSFIAWRKITDTALSQADWIQEAVKHFETMKPLHDFLNRALE